MYETEETYSQHDFIYSFTNSLYYEPEFGIHWLRKKAITFHNLHTTNFFLENTHRKVQNSLIFKEYFFYLHYLF